MLSYFHQTCGSERGQAVTNGRDCTSLWPVSQYISLLHLETRCLLLLFPGEQWKMQHSLGNVMGVQMGFSYHHPFLSQFQPFLLLLQVSDPITLWDQAVQAVCSSLSLPVCQIVAETSCHVSQVSPVRKTAMCPWSVSLTCCAALEEVARARTVMDMAVWVEESSCRHFPCEELQ